MSELEGHPPAQPRGVSSLRREITAAAVAIAIAILAIATVVLIALRNQTVDNADRELATVSRITAERTSQTFSAADLLVRSIVDLAMKPAPGEAGDLRERASTPAFYDRLVRLKNLLPQIDAAAVIDANGDVLASSIQFPAPKSNISNIPFFMKLRDKPDRALLVSDPVAMPRDGRWSIYLGRALKDSRGNFAGIVLGGITSRYFADSFSTIDVGVTATVTLLNDDVRVIARWPEGDDTIGRVLAGWKPGQRPENGETSRYFADDPKTSLRRVALTRLQVEDTPLYVAVSRTQDAQLAPWRSVLVWIVVFALTSLLVTGVLAWFILRAIRDEERWSSALLERETQLSKQAIDLATARDLAETANRARGDFLANMSHELRTPLNAVLGFSEILEKELFGPLGDARYREFAGDIHRSGRHLLEVIGNILDLAKVDAGKLELYEEDVDIAETMRTCARLMTEAANAASVTLEVQPPAESVFIHGDATRIRQIFLNLLSNAVKFTPAGGGVVLSGRADEDGFMFTVTDSGIGMTEDEAVMALQPFRQIDSSLSRRYQGTGLGLPLTKSLVSLHGGAMDIKSAPGQGTTVTVWLPRQRVTPMARAAAE
jgi:signal transduction histidine kinase